MTVYKKTGYLQEDFRVFHLTDENPFEVDFHYHDFHKILIILRGNLSYNIEGRTYDLRTNDVIFVGAGEVHRPILHDASPYERIIIYVSKDYLASYRTKDADLSLCFSNEERNHSHVLRIPGFSTTKLGQLVRELEDSFDSDDYAAELYHNALFLTFLIQLNRTMLQNRGDCMTSSSTTGKMPHVIDYINAHLTEELSIDGLAEKFYMSRFDLMHTFKEETGYSIGNYISTKRLLLAKELIPGGTPVTIACNACGFHNYSSFFRAYKKQFHTAPAAEKTTSLTAYSLEVE